MLLGSRCPACGETFYPRRGCCAVCLGPVEDVELSQTGTLYTYSYIYAPMFGKQQLDAAGYGVGQVDLPEGVRIQTTVEGDPDEWRIGEETSLVYSTVHTEGDVDVVLYSFRAAPS